VSSVSRESKVHEFALTLNNMGKIEQLKKLARLPKDEKLNKL